MRELVYYVGSTVDGYIAGPGGEIDFFPGVMDQPYLDWMAERFPETLPTHVRAHLGLPDVPNREFDTLIMGRGTYQPGLDAGITSPYGTLRQYVVSASLGEIADPAVELVSGDPLELVRRLKQEDGMDIWLCGGGSLAGQLLPEIDRLVVKSYPVVAGSGVRLLDGAFDPAYFEPTERLSFDNGNAVTWFERRPAST